MAVGLSQYSGSGVNVQSLLAGLAAKVTPGALTNAFGTNGNTYIQSGQSTKDIITNVKTLQSTTIANTNTALNAAIQSINTNFKAIGEAISKIGTPAAAAQPTSTVPASPGNQNNSSPTQPDTAHGTDKILSTLDTFKNYIGPTGLAVGAGVIVLLILTRRR